MNLREEWPFIATVPEILVSFFIEIRVAYHVISSMRTIMFIYADSGNPDKSKMVRNVVRAYLVCFDDSCAISERSVYRANPSKSLPYRWLQQPKWPKFFN